MESIQNFLNNHDYDVRKTGNARWIDQKCTHDVVSMIADCILEYIGEDEQQTFTVKDIWNSPYTNENIVDIFAKPDVNNKKANNEYDKFFGQPIKLLAYSGILNEQKQGNKYIYTIQHIELLQYIALRETNALKFLQLYIEKVLRDSKLFHLFEQFFSQQTTTNFNTLKTKFTEFTIQYTKINGELECGRIFTKILDPLAFKLKKKGTIKGHLSKNNIILSDLQYNRLNWRDEWSGKDKSQTRSEYAPTQEEIQVEKLALYAIKKAKKAVRQYNDKYHLGISEIQQSNETVNATQIHHIFPQNEFPTIADYLENLIALTPNQHFSMAHPDNQTRYIDPDFQYICLVAKTASIRDSLLVRKDDFYHFDDYCFVLNTGLNTSEFNLVNDLDFAVLLQKIDEFYSPLENNKYSSFLLS